MSVLVGRKAPDFTAPAVLADGKIIDSLNFHNARQNKYAVILFYPLDFTFVCPSELIALSHRTQALKERNVEVFTVSVDSHFTHNAWRNTSLDKGGIGPVHFTMVADLTHSIQQAYGIEHPSAGIAFRATFLVDSHGVVRHQVVNDLPLGRDMDELIRVVDALHFHEQHGEVCPAGWKKGKEGMKASPQGVAQYLSKNSEGL